MAIGIIYVLNPPQNDVLNLGPRTPGSFVTWFSFMSKMEQKYLPSLPDPCPMEKSTPTYQSRLDMNVCGDKLRMQEIFDLQLSERINRDERITMLSMMDGACFKAEDSIEMFRAWKIVSKELSEPSEIAFKVLIENCQQVINLNDNINYLHIVWNTVNSLSSSRFKEKQFDIFEDLRHIESSFNKQ